MDVENTGVARRRVLAVGAAAVGGVALVACGSDDKDDDKGAQQTATTGASAGAGATGGGTGTTGTTGTSGGGNAGGTVVAKVSEVPVGGGKVDDAAKVVVTQPTAGTYKAFTSICTHQGCPVASVSNNVIACNCHGSRYSAVDGSVQKGPAPKALAEKKITVSGDQIILS